MIAARVLVLVLIGCGGKPPPANDFPPMPDPAWAMGYKQRAQDGCACKDAACLDAAHAELAKVETDHGGMDEAPPSVQQAHGDFDRCWRAGTKDPVRDLADTANQVCACADSACLSRWKLDALHLADKYGVSDLDKIAFGSAPGEASLARARGCLAAVTIKGSDVLAVVEKATEAMCKCENVGCVTSVMKERSDALTKYLEIDGLEDVQPRLDELAPRYCRCMGELVAREVAEKISPFPAATKIDVTMNCK